MGEVIEAVEEATEVMEEGTGEAITARERRRPSQAMVDMEEDILAAMGEDMAEVMEVMAVAMADTAEVTEAMVEATREGDMVTMAKERRSLVTGPTALMDLTEVVAMEAIALAMYLGMDLMEVGMAVTPEVTDHMAEVTATGVNFLVQKKKVNPYLKIILIRPKFIFT